MNKMIATDKIAAYREQEVNSMMRLIDSMCKDTCIGIGARDGQVIIKDQFTGKEYIMREDKNGI